MDSTNTIEALETSLKEEDYATTRDMLEQWTHDSEPDSCIAPKEQEQSEKTECVKNKDHDGYNATWWMLSNLEGYLEVAIEFNQKLPSIELFMQNPGKEPNFASVLPRDIQTFKSNFNYYRSKLTHAIQLLRRIVRPTFNAPEVFISAKDFMFLVEIKHVCNELFHLRDSIMYNYMDLKRDRDSFLWT